jgi:CHAT domain-containing protein
MFPALLLFVLASSVTNDTIAQRFCQTLTAGDPRELSGEGWRSVRDVVDHYDCISVTSCRATTDASSGALLLEIDATGVARNERRETSVLPRHWTLTRTESGIASAESEASDVPERARRLADIAIDEANLPPAGTREAAVALLEWSEAHGDAESETYALSALAVLAHRVPGSDAAQLSERAVCAAARSGSVEADAYASFAAGLTASDSTRAAFFDHAAANVESLEDPRIALRALYELAGAHSLTYELGRVYDDVTRLESLSARYGDRIGTAAGLYARARLAATVADPSTPELAAQTRAAAHRLGVPRFETSALTLEAKVLLDRGERRDYALSLHQEALRIVPPGMISLRIYTLAALADEMLRRNRFSEADRYLEAAEKDSLLDKTNLSNVLLIGQVLRSLEGEPAEAKRYYERLAAEMKGSMWMLWAGKWVLARMLADCGDDDGAINELEETIDLLERRYVLTPGNGTLRAQHFSSRIDIYRLLLHLLVRQHRLEEALSVAERMRARLLDERLTGADQPLRLTSGEVEQQRALNQRIVDLNRLLLTSPAGERKTRQELRRARAELEAFSFAVAMKHPSEIPRDPASDLAWSARDGTVIEFAVADGLVFAFVLRDGRVSALQLPRDAAAIQHDVETLRNRIDGRDLAWAPPARRLYDSLLAPLASLLPKRGAVTIVPDSFLWDVPFQALLEPSRRFFGDRHALAYAPSLTMLEWAARSRSHAPAQKTLLAMGDPKVPAIPSAKQSGYRNIPREPLPDAIHEVRELAMLYGRERSAVFTGSEARESVLKRSIGSYRIVHLATHGIVDDDSPFYSALLLAASKDDRDDGLLEMREVRDLELNADLVVLSACDTARGKVYSGEGVIGLAWAFLGAGCPTTVVSQWKAASRATTLLMVEFHQRLLAGDTTAEAMRRAQRMLRRNPAYAHPLYWAPFVVVGRSSAIYGRIANARAGKP